MNARRRQQQARARRVPRFRHDGRGRRDCQCESPCSSRPSRRPSRRRCKECGLHTALDTSGFLGARADDALIGDTDLVLLDIKSFDADVYHALTGGDLAPTLEFARRLDRLSTRMWIRYVLVPGWTDDLKAVDGLARFVAGLHGVEPADVLPFHKLGAPKYRQLGIPFPLRDTPVPDPALKSGERKVFRQRGASAY